MKETTASSSLFKIVLAFTLIFSGFISLAIVYNRAFRLKNESLAIIEKYEGNVEKTIQLINNYLDKNGYNTKGKCDNGEYGVESLDDIDLTLNSNKKYYCISQTCSNKVCHYNIKLFFKFELPIFGEIFTYKITGKTKSINYYSEKQILK